MNSSESIKNLSSALVKAQKTMGGAVKDSKNPFFKSSYADLTSVIKAIKEPFASAGIAYTQFPINDENRVGVVTRLMHESGEWLETSYTLPLVKNDPQSAGSAITYARRYALQSIAGIPTADDDAESAMIRGNTDVIDDMQLKAVTNLLKETKADVKAFCIAYGIPSTNKMPKEKFDRAIAALNTKKDRALQEAEKAAIKVKEAAA